MDTAYADAYPELYRHHWWWRVREEILLAKIRTLCPSHTSNARILDVGCGAGLFLDALEEFGHVEGIEADALAVLRSGRWQHRITVGQLDDSFVPREAFDLSLLLDVLEHVDQPETLLRRAGTVLRPTGRILITVPAFNWLWTRHDEMNHHVRRYTVQEVRHVIDDAGLAVVEAGYMFQSLVVPKLLVRLKEAIVSQTPQVPKIPGPLLNRSLQTWYRTEYAVAGWLPFGGSLMVVARRRD